ncbi:amidase family protein [Piscinibacter koreensis]|uniref:Amidase n=1 Tax=Piscinibacter koreensis TaxID=2742824 RepID=A0A7Y6NRB8_9BURK|nr:amidase family protein [Schlegelella koreensis]NUZ07890.1 amidase [Schlegelella koreensis]
MKRKYAYPSFLSLCVLAACGGGSDDDKSGPTTFQLQEATVDDIKAATESDLITSEQLVGMYFSRIFAYDKAGPRLNSILHVNPNALSRARELDAQGGSKGPLHGIPVLLKDNIDTVDMPTTAGSVALANTYPAKDAFITRKLRDAGAIIIGKANLTEYANFLTSGMPAGYSSLGGYVLNPYDPRALPGGDGRPVLTPGGSSSGPGAATAANLTALSIGSETSGSILSPASANDVVGIKPTLGLVSRSGILPISADQDTAGPITRTVRDAAILLGVIAGHDPADPATAACQTAGNCFSDYTQFLDANALAGARILVPPFPTNRATIMEAAITVLQAKGATVVRQSTALANVTAPSVLNYGFKRDLNAYLATRPASQTVRTLADIIAFNAATPGALKYGQTLAIASDALSLDPSSADTAAYQANLAAGYSQSRGILNGALSGPDGVAGNADDYDALLFSGNSGAGTPARAGFPTVIVPGGTVPAVAPIEQPTPSGVAFSGRAFSEPRLIALAYAFEQATKLRRPPASTPALAGEVVTR